MNHSFACRACDSTVTRSVVDLGLSPLCQTQVGFSEQNMSEVFYPLHAYICDQCHLLQLDEYVEPGNIFSNDYPYFSSYSDSWVAHAKRYVDKVTDRFEMNADSFAVELASNDGYLLQHFVARSIPCLGIEPAGNCAQAARDKGVPTESVFFGRDTADKIKQSHGLADLIIGNNVLAHVPNLNDFVGGMKNLLKADGVVTMEFPHLLELIEHNQFDTIYHEHFSYFSFMVAQSVFERHGMELFDVDTLSTHGGSIRIYAQHKGTRDLTERVAAMVEKEKAAGLNTFGVYEEFADRVTMVKRRLLEFLIKARDENKKVVGYGAPGKGNTLLNYCGIGTDLLDFTVDRSPHKQNHLTPGSRIPILHPDVIKEARPDYVLILPWNLEKEIAEQLAYIKEWGGQFVVPIPSVTVRD